jgi:hypothetical protein
LHNDSEAKLYSAVAACDTMSQTDNDNALLGPVAGRKCMRAKAQNMAVSRREKLWHGSKSHLTDSSDSASAESLQRDDSLRRRCWNRISFLLTDFIIIRLQMLLIMMLFR